MAINYMTRSMEAEALHTEIIAAGGRAAVLQADVADPAVVEAMLAKVQAELGPVSILVNNAGVSGPATLDSYNPALLDRMRAVNVNGMIQASIHATRGVDA